MHRISKVILLNVGSFCKPVFVGVYFRLRRKRDNPRLRIDLWKWTICTNSMLYSPPTGRVPHAIRTLYYGPSPIFFPQNPSGHQHPLSTFCPFFWFTLSHHVNLCSLYRCRPNHPFPLIHSGLERCFTVFSVVDGLESVVLIRSLTRAAVS